MLEILSDHHITIKLPKIFNAESMYPLMSAALTIEGNVVCKHIDFDFTELEFIEPVGVVVLSNLVEFLRRAGAGGNFHGVFDQSKGVRYLDQSGFFERYHGGPINPGTRCKDGTLPLTLVESIKAFNFLNSKMIPWMARTLGVSEEGLSTVRMCLEEILQNVSDHSGVEVGCVHAQYREDLGLLDIAISDFGHGIPYNVKKFAESVSNPSPYDPSKYTTDAAALKLACEQGFSTRSNVRNRGAGLPNLLSVVAGTKRGTVFIVSGQGVVSAVHKNGAAKLTARTRSAVYPGTLVRVILDVSVVKDFEKDIEQQEFSWN